MRILLSIVGLLVVVAIVGLLARQQLTATPATLPKADGSTATSAPPATQREQAQQFQQQYKQMLEGALQQPRPTGDEAR